MKIYDCISTPNHHHLFLEYCAIGTLENYIKNERPNEETAIQLFKGICNGYSQLHENGIIHIDLKPLNILLKKEEGVLVPKISDFGLSEQIYQLNDQLGITDVGLFIDKGSPFYKCPQIYMDQECTYLCDIYSLGIIFYELIFHKPPFSAPNRYLLQDKILMGEFTMDTSKISIESAQLILRCMNYLEIGRYHLKDVLKSDVFTKDYTSLTRYKHPDIAQKFTNKSFWVNNFEDLLT